METSPTPATQDRVEEREIATRAYPQAANAITLLRVLAIPAFVWAAWRAHAGNASPLPALVFFLAAASDLADGPVARRLGTASESGRLVDHVADIGFITTALATYWRLGVAPWWVPTAIFASFLFYVADSWRRSAGGDARRLIGSRLGHLAGVCNYTLVGVLACNQSAGLHWLPPTVTWVLFAAVPLYSGAAVLNRLMARTR